jgi:hypothetical protein
MASQLGVGGEFHFLFERQCVWLQWGFWGWGCDRLQDPLESSGCCGSLLGWLQVVSELLESPLGKTVSIADIQ